MSSSDDPFGTDGSGVYILMLLVGDVVETTEWIPAGWWVWYGVPLAGTYAGLAVSSWGSAPEYATSAGVSEGSSLLAWGEDLSPFDVVWSSSCVTFDDSFSLAEPEGSAGCDAWVAVGLVWNRPVSPLCGVSLGWVAGSCSCHSFESCGLCSDDANCTLLLCILSTCGLPFAVMVDTSEW